MVGKMGKLKFQTSSYTIKFQRCNIWHNEYGHQYCNNFLWGQVVTRPIVGSMYNADNIKSISRTPETDIILYINYIAVKKVNNKLHICKIGWFDNPLILIALLKAN